jgi:hypothetical protein
MLAAQIGVTVCSVAITRWLDQDGARPLSELARDTLSAVRSIVADPAGSPHDASPRIPTTPATSE